MRPSAAMTSFAMLALVAGCEQRSPAVYVLESPQTVVLTASASASTVKQGDTVVLRVARRTVGNWKQIPRDQLRPGQCWVYQRPREDEPEVAQSVQWDVTPENSVRFHQDYQLDQTRVATMMVKGKITLTPVATVKCEEGRSAVGSPIEIEVL